MSITDIPNSNSIQSYKDERELQSRALRRIGVLGNHISPVAHPSPLNSSRASVEPSCACGNISQIFRSLFTDIGKEFTSACERGDATVVNRLKNHPKLTQKDLDEGFATACRLGHNSVVEALKDHYPKVSLTKGLIEVRSIEIFNLLKGLMHLTGADLMQGFQAAYLHRRTELLEAYLRHPLFNHDQGIHLACQTGHFEVVKLIVQNLSRADFYDKGFKTACKYDCEMDILERLLQFPITVRGLHEGIAKIQDKGKRSALLKLYPKHLSSHTIRNTFLHAYECKNFTFIEAIKDHPELLSSDAIDLIFYLACEKGETEVVKSLMNHPRLSLDQRDLGFSLAWETSHQNILSLLEKAGAKLLTVSPRPCGPHAWVKLFDAQPAVLEGPNGKKYDFGAHIHGFGKGVVKGNNLCVRRTSSSEGKPVIELSFKINRPFRTRLERLVTSMQQLSDEDRRLLPPFAIQSVDHFMLMQKKIEKPGIAWEIIFPGLGKAIIGRESINISDRVIIQVSEEKKTEHLEQLLSIIGLSDVLQASSTDDLKRMEIAYLFRAFYPLEAMAMEQDIAYFSFPLDELKRKIIQKQPQMQEILEKYSAWPQEVLPGYVRPNFPILSQEAYARGARMLTTALTSIHASDTFQNEHLDQLANIIKNGLFSHEMRDKTLMEGEGLSASWDHYKTGGADCIFTNVVRQKDIDSNGPAHKLFFTSSPFRLYISLQALNRGSYQYDNNNGGNRSFYDYASRPSIRQFLEDSHLVEGEHEIMLYTRVLPEEIQAIVVPSLEIKGRLLKHLREKKIVQIDSQGKEHIHGIPVEKFIIVHDRYELVKDPTIIERCSKMPKAKL